MSVGLRKDASFNSVEMVPLTSGSVALQGVVVCWYTFSGEVVAATVVFMAFDQEGYFLNWVAAAVDILRAVMSWCTFPGKVAMVSVVCACVKLGICLS